MIAYARLQGNLDSSKVKYGWYKGMVSAVMPDAAVQDLFMMEGFSCARLLPKADGIGYHKVLREVGFYREQRFGRSGAIMQSWKNPLTKEEVAVVPIANDPFNYDITPNFPGATKLRRPERRQALSENSVQVTLDTGNL